MDWLFWFSLLLTHLPLTESKEKADGCLVQPEKMMRRKIGQTVVLPCSVSSDCSDTDLKYEWFVFKHNGHLPLSLSGKYSLNGANLHIKSLRVNDSGIYHCAAVKPGEPKSGTQHVGPGTALTVTGKMARHNLLFLSFVLLVIYSIAVVTLIILKKSGCSMSACRRMYKSDKNYSTKKINFRDVLQEMNNRRDLKRSKQSSGRNRSQVEAPSTDVNSSADRIYENV